MRIIILKPTPDRREPDTFDHVFRLCPHPLLLHCRNVWNEQLAQYQITTDIEQRLLPMLTQLVLSPERHRICLGNWNTEQLEALLTVLLSSDSSEAISAVLLVGTWGLLIVRYFCITIIKLKDFREVQCY